MGCILKFSHTKLQVSRQITWVTDIHAKVMTAGLVAIRRRRCNALLNVGKKWKRRRAKVNEIVGLWTMDFIAAMVKERGIATMNMGLHVINPAIKRTTKIITVCTKSKEFVSIYFSRFHDTLIIGHPINNY